MPSIISSTDRMIAERQMGLLCILRGHNQAFVPFRTIPGIKLRGCAARQVFQVAPEHFDYVVMPAISGDRNDGAAAVVIALYIFEQLRSLNSSNRLQRTSQRSTQGMSRPNRLAQ